MITKKSVSRAMFYSWVVSVGLFFSSHVMAGGKGFSPYVNGKGEIRFPDEFRTSMAHIGSWFAPEGGASGFHDVYTEQKTIEHYRRTGKFPDGATLVKELRAANKGDYTTGTGVHYSTDGIKQWFVMIKDEKGRFPGNDLWGEGWGWALFKPADQQKNVAVDYKADCLGCHIPAKQTDWIYIEGYPVLTETN